MDRRVTAGELVGFCCPALIGALLWDSAGFSELPALMAAGAVEGAVLALTVAIGALGGLAMAASMALATGVAMRHLLRGDRAARIA